MKNELPYLMAKKIFAAKIVEFDESKLTQTEQEIFDILKRVVADNNLDMTLRVAGGWVRDKLLGVNSKDIDIAVDRGSGEEFANLVHDWLENNGYEAKGVGIIEANPDQSKHLATATTFILGLPIDFVNLRTETYAENSRIPTVSVGTPEEDAFRRDLTINALFYNINTGKVEDFTGKGIEDLKNGVIRTPLDPKITFKEDPLRILRGIKFSARYGFQLAPDLIEAAKDKNIIDALDKKVSKERIGAELKGMLKSQNPAQALRILKDLGLRDAVFKKPEGLSPWDMDQRNPHHELFLWDHLVKVVETLNDIIKDKDVESDDKIILLLAALMHDIGKLDPSIQGEKELEGQMIASYHGHEESSARIAEHLLRELKLSNKEIEGVINLIAPAGRAEQLSRTNKTPSRKALAKLVRMVGEKWQHALWLAMADDASKKRDGVEKDKFTPYLSMIKQINEMDLTEAHQIKPILNGKEIMDILQLKPGPQVGEALSQLMDWQLENPEASKDDAIRWVLSNLSANASFPLSLNLTKVAGQPLEFNKGYVYLPVNKPDYAVPEGLKDRGEFHITIISPSEVREVAKATGGDKKELFSNLYLSGEPQYLGLGKATEGDNEVYYVVVKWPESQELRKKFGLPNKDLHITLAFKENDIFDVKKDETTLI